MKITLCGSMKFIEAFRDWDQILSKAGYVVYTVVDSGHNYDRVISNEEKRRYDLIHLQKITESDAIVVLNVDGYIGESTQREIEWAYMNRKDVYWLENAKPRFLGPTIWSLYNLFDGGIPIASIKEADKYRMDKPE